MTLHYTFLFGSVSRTANDERPPLTPFQHAGRKLVASAILRRLPEIVTPVGTLAVEGYSPVRDWLSPDQIAPILGTLGSGQVHVFSAGEELARDGWFAELARRDILVLHSASLAQVLNQGADGGLIRLGPPQGTFERAIEIETGVINVPKEIWVRITRSAGVLDDTALMDPPPLSDEARYREFRTFLSSAEGLPRWEHYSRGLAFRRETEQELYDLAIRGLESQRLQEQPVVLHGQTGSGKTVALAALAHRVRGDRRFPVLFIERRADEPVVSDIALFCEWAETEGAAATLVVWDGMRDVSKYRELTRYLTSRGRKVVVVGSSYSLRGRERAHLVDVDRVIPPHEHFGPEVAEVLHEVVGERVVVVDDEDHERG
jgi:hypothetical protein